MIHAPTHHELNLDSLLKDETLGLIMFASDKFKMAQLVPKLVLDRSQVIVGKEKNSSNHHVLLFPECFLKRLLNVRNAWLRFNPFPNKSLFLRGFST